MRAAPLSRVILTDEEVEAKMRSEGADANQIASAIGERQAHRQQAQDGYDKTQPAPEYRRLPD